MIHVYTGNGKGKTTSALGMALRSLGIGRKVAVIQFLKGVETGEIKGLDRFDNCLLRQFGTKELIVKLPADDIYLQLVEEGCSLAEKILRDRAADLLILDEINIALDLGLVEIKRIVDLIRNCPEEIELILTGRNCPPEIIDCADYVSEILEIKHPFQIGITAREGIEY